MARFGTGISKICGVVAASTSSEMVKFVRLARRETPTLELRLDWLATDAERMRFLAWLKRHRPAGTTFIVTCRRKPGGGRFPGDIPAQLYWLMQARDAGCQWCDLEVETLRELPGKSVRKYAVPKRVMLSLHDFDRTPPLSRPFHPPSHGEIDAVKIAAHCHTLADSARLLRLGRRSRDCVVVPMGEVGLPARLLALREGSVLAYAPVGPATAPGQVSLREMTHLYRAHELTRRTQIYGVIGDPVAHSLSPLLHNTGFVQRKLDAVYLPFLVHDLRDFLRVLPDFGVRGFSVTLPHKQTILKHLQDCDPLAADIGAVNTVFVRRDGSLYGSNTDYVGVLRSLQCHLDLRSSRILMFGAGGSGRAAAFALSRAGANVVVCARRDRAARELARAVSGEAIPRHALLTEPFDAILNATPIGMHPQEAISPLRPQELNCRLVMDLIYRPEQTRLLKLAEHMKIATVSGVEMFLAQGIAQWELWMRRRAPEAAMSRAVRAALRMESRGIAVTPRKKRVSR